MCIFIIGFGISHQSLNPTLKTQLNQSQIFRGEITASKINSNSNTYFLTLTNGEKTYFYSDKKLNIGDYISYSGIAVPIRKRLNPVDFNAKNYYASKRIYFSLDDGEPIYITTHKGLNYYLQKYKERLSDVYDEILPPVDAGLVKAMVLGITDDIEDETYESFRRSGIVHLLCISGLHLSILSYAVMLILEKPLGKRYAAAATIPLAAVYCIFCGASVSIIRSVLMFGFYALSKLFYREYSLLHSTCTACIIILLANPMYLYNMGFQYSFACVFIIGMVSQIAEFYGFSDKKYIGIIITACVTTFIKPITCYYYYSINFADIASNSLATPLAPAIVLLGFLCGLVGLFCLPLAKLIATIPFVALEIIRFISESANATPVSAVTTGYISGYVVVAFAVLIIVLYNVLMKNISKLWLLTGTLLVPLVCIRNIPDVSFPYIGHGDCAVITGENYLSLIDAGSSVYSKRGVKTILPYIHYLGADHIDEVYISHTDYDHIGGLYEIMDLIDIGTVYTVPTSSEKYKNFCNKIKEHHIKLVELKRGDILKPCKDIRFTVLAPAKKFDSENNSSMVLMLDYCRSRLLFTGDIQKAGIDELLSSSLIDCDILKLPHHGGKIKNTDLLLQHTTPSLSIACAAINDRYNHPAEETLEINKKYSIPVYCTGDGMICIDAKNKFVTVYNDENVLCDNSRKAEY